MTPWFLPLITVAGLTLFAACLAVGAAVIAGGWFGTARPRSPLCGGCGHGIALVPNAAARACQECGRDLRGPGAIRYFARKRDVRRILRGIAIGACSVLVVIATQVIARFGMSIPTVGATTPTADLVAILAGEGVGRDGQNTDMFRMAAEESARRLAAGALAADERLSVVRAILARPHLAPTTYVAIEQDELIRAAHADGLITREEFVGYLQGRVGPPNLDMPGRVRVPTRRFIALSSEVATHLAVDRALKGATFLPAGGGDQAAIAIPVVDHSDRELTIVAPGNHAFLKLPAMQAAGTLTLTIEETFRLPSVAATPTATPIAIADRHCSVPLGLEPFEAPTWIGVASPADQRDAVRQACMIRAVAIDDDATGSERSVRVDCELGAVEGLALAFDIVVVVGDREIVVAQRTIHRHNGSTRSSMSWPGRPTLPVSADPLPPRVTVRFRPNPSLAEEFPGVTEVWGETITIEGVPLSSSVNAPAPASAGGQP